MDPHSNSETLERIHAGLEAARRVLDRFTAGAVATQFKAGDDPVTAADHAVDAVLRENLLREGEGWLSEEIADDPARLEKNRVWVVDPLDGTREFVAGIPEFCVSIAMVENGIPIAGGICNPATNETFVGSLASGVSYNGRAVRSSPRAKLHGASVLASRSEMKRGEWDAFKGTELNVKAMGSVAYKLALVAAGLADVTFTLTPKNEWDVAAGAALVTAAGGHVQTLENTPLRCNRKDPLLSGLIACGPNLRDELVLLLSDHLQAAARR